MFVADVCYVKNLTWRHFTARVAYSVSAWAGGGVVWQAQVDGSSLGTFRLDSALSGGGRQQSQQRWLFCRSLALHVVVSLSVAICSFSKNVMIHDPRLLTRHSSTYTCCDKPKIMYSCMYGVSTLSEWCAHTWLFGFWWRNISWLYCEFFLRLCRINNCLFVCSPDRLPVRFTPIRPPSVQLKKLHFEIPHFQTPSVFVGRDWVFKQILQVRARSATASVMYKCTIILYLVALLWHFVTA